MFLICKITDSYKSCNLSMHLQMMKRVMSNPYACIYYFVVSNSMIGYPFSSFLFSKFSASTERFPFLIEVLVAVILGSVAFSLFVLKWQGRRAMVNSVFQSVVLVCSSFAIFCSSQTVFNFTSISSQGFNSKIILSIGIFNFLQIEEYVKRLSKNCRKWEQLGDFVKDDFEICDFSHKSATIFFKLDFATVLFFILNLLYCVIYLNIGICSSMVVLGTIFAFHYLHLNIFVPAVISLMHDLKFQVFEQERGKKEVGKKHSRGKLGNVKSIRMVLLLVLVLVVTNFASLNLRVDSIIFINGNFWRYFKIIEFILLNCLIGFPLYFLLEFVKIHYKFGNVDIEIDSTKLDAPSLLEYHCVSLINDENGKEMIQDFISDLQRQCVIVHRQSFIEIIKPFQHSTGGDIIQLNGKQAKLIKWEIHNSRYIGFIYQDGIVSLYDLALKLWIFQKEQITTGGKVFEIKESFIKYKLTTASVTNNDNNIQGQYAIVSKNGYMNMIYFQISLFPFPTMKLQKKHFSICDTDIVECTKMITDRVNDRLVFNDINGHLYICQEIVNKPWKSRKLDVVENSFNTIVTKRRASTRMSIPNEEPERSPLESNRWNSPHCKIINLSHFGFTFIFNTETRKSYIIDILSGMLLKTIQINPNYCDDDSLKIFSGRKPTFCKFCGSCSIEKLIIIYNISVKGNDDDDDDNDRTVKHLKMHVFKTNKKNKKIICLRVERDPREIRCFGLDSVLEKHYLYDNVTNWTLKMYKEKDKEEDEDKERTSNNNGEEEDEEDDDDDDSNINSNSNSTKIIGVVDSGSKSSDDMLCIIDTNKKKKYSLTTFPIKHYKSNRHNSNMKPFINNSLVLGHNPHKLDLIYGLEV